MKKNIASKPAKNMTQDTAIEDLEIDYENHEDDNVETFKLHFRCTFCKASFDENEKLIQHFTCAGSYLRSKIDIKKLAQWPEIALGCCRQLLKTGKKKNVIKKD